MSYSVKLVALKWKNERHRIITVKELISYISFLFDIETVSSAVAVTVHWTSIQGHQNFSRFGSPGVCWGQRDPVIDTGSCF